MTEATSPPPAPTTTRAPRLAVLNGALRGQVFAVEHPLVLGRATECELSIADARLSRKHARFALDPDGALVVEDLASHNGTFVNGERLAGAPRVLVAGDVVFAGATEVLVEGGPVRARSMGRATIELVGEADVPARALANAVVRSVRSGDALLASSGRHFAVLLELARAVQRERDEAAMLDRALDILLGAFHADRAYVALFDPSAGGALVPRAVRGLDSTERVVLSRTVAERVVQGRAGVLSLDTATDARFARAQSVAAADVRALLAAPVMVADRVLGLVALESARPAVARFGEGELDALTVAASLLGVALDNLALGEAREHTIRELTEAREKLLATQERLVRSEQLAIVGRFASGLAHEVKNHLSPFMLAEMIRARYADDREIQTAAELMLEAQREILGLVNEVRDFAAVGAGQRALDAVAPCDVRALCEGVLRFLQCDAQVKRARVVLEAGGGSPVVALDAGRIRQVLINLIRNASDAVAPGRGRITVRVSEVDDGAVIEVEDDGVGIPSEIAARVFEPFFSTKGENGLGLGLDISRGIVAAHGGTLTFASTEGRGTTFRVEIPTRNASLT